jgi:predicted AAA+ superfamily ATPase
MERTIHQRLCAWQKSRDRKPLLLQGPRQVGKTHSLKEFGSSCFSACHYINFEEDERLGAAFAGDLSPRIILQNLSLRLNRTMAPATDLLILDEIQQCPRALTSLKYFAEDLPNLAVCAAGSLLGVHLGECSFPVGKVDLCAMHPLSFEEFLMALDEPLLLDGWRSLAATATVSETLHDRLWERLKHYLVTGGLPDVVRRFVAGRDDLALAFTEARAAQAALLTAYAADMAKHSGKQNAMHIERLWRNIPAQLGRDASGSAPKFAFGDVLPGVKGYERLAGTIDWLVAAGLVTRLPIVNSGQVPLGAYERANFFKLFVFDVGLLGALARLPPQAILDSDYGTYKGFVAENLVLQELTAAGRTGLACWREGRAEVEFLCELHGQLIPVEVKSGWVTQAKGLKVFCDKYQPPFCAVLSGRPLDAASERRKRYYPLYLAARFLDPEFSEPIGSGVGSG